VPERHVAAARFDPPRWCAEGGACPTTVVAGVDGNMIQYGADHEKIDQLWNDKGCQDARDVESGKVDLEK